MSPLRRLPRLTRDGILFAVGLLGLLHEIIATSLDRPLVIGACMVLMGVPITTTKDRK